jgi:GNAT superfamily N-acetyltransferase
VTLRVTDERALRIRQMVAGDAPAVAELLSQLGYPPLADIDVRIGELVRDSAQLLLVGTIADRVVAWIHAQAHGGLTGNPFVEIEGLVVDQTIRRGGVGRRLVAAVERWARECGAPTLRVRSRVTRPEAHAFYRALGFALVKTQHVYDKPT